MLSRAEARLLMLIAEELAPQNTRLQLAIKELITERKKAKKGNLRDVEDREDEEQLRRGDFLMSIKDRGFASMERQKQRAIASAGGKRAHQLGRAHQFTSDEAREAGRRGGAARQRKKSRETA